MNFVAIDSGTTNTRIWLIRDRSVRRRVEIPVGVRNTAIDGNNRALRHGVIQAIKEMQGSASTEDTARHAVAAGMITSNLGLKEVRHIQAPASIGDLVDRIERVEFPELGNLPFCFVPGIRFGPVPATLENLNAVDMLRGEETELTGFLHQANMQGPLLYIHLGSHTKLLTVDKENFINGSVSTLAGEVTRAIRENTILSDSLPGGLKAPFEEIWLQKGWNICREFGLLRALYLIRILHVNSPYSRHNLGSLYLGALISEDFRCLDLLLSKVTPPAIVLSGLPELQPAWEYFLKARSLPFRSLTAEETEAAFLRGTFEILSRHLARSSSSPF